MTIPEDVRINVSAAFPTRVVGQEGVEVSKANGVYTIGEAYEMLAPLGTVPAPAQKLVKVWDSVTGIYNTLPLSVVPGASFNIASVTAGASYLAAATDDLIVVQKTVGSATQVTLPAAASRTRGPVYIKDGKGDANTNNITVLFNGTEKADGLASVVIRTPYGVVALAANPAGGWVILNFG